MNITLCKKVSTSDDYFSFDEYGIVHQDHYVKKGFDWRRFIIDWPRFACDRRRFAIDWRRFAIDYCLRVEAFIMMNHDEGVRALFSLS